MLSNFNLNPVISHKSNPNLSHFCMRTTNMIYRNSMKSNHLITWSINQSLTNKTALNTIHLINLINITFIEVIKQNELKEMRLLGSTQQFFFHNTIIFFTQALKSSKDQRTSIQRKKKRIIFIENYQNKSLLNAKRFLFLCIYSVIH